MNSTPRPASATAFGILNIVFAAFGVFGILGSIVLIGLAASSDNPMVANNPALKVMRESPAFASWIKLTIPLGFVACAALLAAGIGLLRTKNWGRKLSIAYGIYAIVFGLVGTVVNFLFLVSPMLENASQQPGPQAAGAIGGAVGAVIGGVIGMIYPVLLIFFMTRPKVVAAFQSDR